MPARTPSTTIEVYEQPSGATLVPAYAKTTIYTAGISVALVLMASAWR